MPARRNKSLHHNLKEGKNVVYHREHRSKRGRKDRSLIEKRRFRKFKAEASRIRFIEREIEMVRRHNGAVPGHDIVG